MVVLELLYHSFLTIKSPIYITFFYDISHELFIFIIKFWIGIKADEHLIAGDWNFGLIVNATKICNNFWRLTSSLIYFDVILSFFNLDKYRYLCTYFIQGPLRQKEILTQFFWKNLGKNHSASPDFIKDGYWLDK